MKVEGKELSASFNPFFIPFSGGFFEENRFLIEIVPLEKTGTP